MKRLKFKKQTSDVQDRIDAYPELFAEFRELERALCQADGGGLYVEPAIQFAAERRLDALDKFFGFEQESQFRKSGIETSQWQGRRF